MKNGASSRYPGHIRKHTFTGFLAEAMLHHLKCNFDLVIDIWKQNHNFLSLYVTETDSKIFCFFDETCMHHTSYSVCFLSVCLYLVSGLGVCANFLSIAQELLSLQKEIIQTRKRLPVLHFAPSKEYKVIQ